MTAARLARLREVARELAVGGLVGALLAMPLPIARTLTHGPGSPLEASGWASTLLIAIAPGLVFALGAYTVGIPLNALLWAGSWVVWRSRNPHGSAVAAKVITATCWCGWAACALLIGLGPASS